MKLGAAVAGLGALLMAFGLAIGSFLCRVPGAVCSRPTLADVAFYGGLALVGFGLARLLWAGWQGSRLSWLVAAPAAGLLTWTGYELVRQGVPLPGIAFLGPMTAPALSVAAAVATLTVGRIQIASQPRR